MPTDLAVAGDDLFVTTETADGGLIECKSTDCVAPSVVVSGLSQNGAIAADATRLYYSAADVFLRTCRRRCVEARARFEARAHFPSAMSTLKKSVPRVTRPPSTMPVRARPQPFLSGFRRRSRTPMIPRTRPAMPSGKKKIPNSPR